ncbi:MAG TPA: tetratricopeptide repeat protein [Gemmataceae bacterium]|jgi:tetratricopeptide (TPR) repeat protein|nr:tetratricopeptide repeat protein [Gemmataceae bacterium]
MAVSNYAGCPCGSGKLFKWCCQPYYSYVERAIHQIEHKQPAAAEQSATQLVEKNPDVPQAWAYQAQVLALLGKSDQAEAALQKALELNPNLAYSHFLRASMRLDEGEFVGALKLFRSTAELVESAAAQLDANVHSRIAQLELQFNRPVAARSALARAVQVTPQDAELRQTFNALFGADARLPEIARKEYRFRPVAPDAAQVWNQAMESAQAGKFGPANKLFEQGVDASIGDAAQLFNVGLLRALSGENRKAIEALSRSIDAESDEAALEEAGALVEVLRLGTGMEDEADYLEYRAFLQIREAEPLRSLFHDWSNAGRLLVVKANEEDGSFSALILEGPQDFGISVGVPLARIQSYLYVDGDLMRFWHSSREMLDRTVNDLRSKVRAAVSEPEYQTGPAAYGDVVAEIMIFPTRDGADPEQINERMRDRARSFFEESWLRRPLKSLRGASPLDAAAHPGSRKRLFGLVKFMEECLKRDAGGDGKPSTPLYDFNRMRRKLGLSTGEGADLDFDTMSTAALGGIKPTTLTDDQVGQAFRAALRLDAPDLAVRFAGNAVERPSIADRYPYFSHLITSARDDGQWQKAIEVHAAAEDADRTTNANQRQIDLALSCGRTLAMSGDTAGAHGVFQDAIRQSPRDLRLYAPAAEVMLGKREGGKALEFVEAGLKEARSQNNRDAEQHLLELLSAAKKQVG